MSTRLPSPTLAVSAFVFSSDNRLLVVKRGRPPGVGLWSVPGGKVMGGESLHAAVAREVREETGCAVTCGPVLAVLERMDHGAVPYHFVIVAHIATLQADAAPRAGSDAAAAEFVELAELANRACTEGLLDLARQASASLPARQPRPAGAI